MSKKPMTDNQREARFKLQMFAWIVSLLCFLLPMINAHFLGVTVDHISGFSLATHWHLFGDDMGRCLPVTIAGIFAIIAPINKLLGRKCSGEICSILCVFLVSMTPAVLNSGAEVDAGDLAGYKASYGLYLIVIFQLIAIFSGVIARRFVHAKARQEDPWASEPQMKTISQSGAMATKSMPTYTKGKKKSKLPLILVGVVLLFIIGILCIPSDKNGPDQDSPEEAISTVKDGYLGDYTNVTIGQVLEDATDTSGDASWTTKEQDGKTYVIYRVPLSDGTTDNDVIFQMLTPDTFQLVSVNEDETEMKDRDLLAQFGHSLYIGYYGFQYADNPSALESELPDTSADRVLYGSSASFSGDREALFSHCTSPYTAVDYYNGSVPG